MRSTYRFLKTDAQQDFSNLLNQRGQVRDSFNTTVCK